MSFTSSDLMHLHQVLYRYYGMHLVEYETLDKYNILACSN